MSIRRPLSEPKAGYLNQDTIAACSTPLGGAIAILRVSGPRALKTLAILSGREGYRAGEVRRVQLSSSDGMPLDDAVVSVYCAPKSFTGEDVVEYQIHGSTLIAEKLLSELRGEGVRSALAGEFSFRAVRNGKMTLAQAQAIPDLLAASNENALALALEKLSGAQNQILLELGEALRQLAALGEVGIDFSDQDQDEVSELGMVRLRQETQSVIEQLEILEASFSRGEKIQDGVRVAVVGLPNAGKSSFFNTLLGEDRSIVSDVRGTTRDLIRERLVLNGNGQSVTFRVEDTAGLRKTTDAVEAIGVGRSMESARRADLVLLILDSGEASEEALSEWRALDISPERTIGVWTKTDLFSEAPPVCEIPKWISVSAVTSKGVSAVVEELVARAGRWTSRRPGELLLTRLDHLEAVTEALKHLRRALTLEEHDLFASDLRQALSALSPLLGEIPTDEILNRIFGQFCIGK